ncbi:MAG: CDP-diacylglycerol--serine O-phosphatidyltransferase [Minicystis sp.]
MAKRRRFDLKKSLFLLPNMITLSSIFCGFYSICKSAAATGEDAFYKAAILIVFAMFFDILDGRVARATKTQSAFGLQIDSLADVISFGAAPAMLVYRWTLHRLDEGPAPIGLIASFVYIACGAIRLARFNVLTMGEAGAPTKPTKYIVGLPIPGAAGILVSIIVANHAAAGVLGGVEYVWPLFAVTLGLSFLMVSTIRFRSFKEMKLNARTVLLVGFAVGSSALISYKLKPQFVLVWLLGFYIMFGIFESLWQLPGRLRERAALARSEGGSVPPAGRSSTPPQS